MDPATALLIGSGVSAAAGGASAIASGKMNRKSIKYNKWALEKQQEYNTQQAQISRDWSEAMMDKENEWNLAQWNRENTYNSPAAMKARYEGAGLNAALMMQGGSNVGQAASSQPAASPHSGPTASSSTGGSPQLVRPDFTLLSSAVDSFFKNKLIDTQAQGQGLDNLLKSRYGDDLARLSIGKGNAEIANLRAQTASNYANAAVASMKAKEQEVLNKYLDMGQQLGLITKMAEYASITAGTKLKSAQYRTEVAREIEILASANGKEISNRVAMATADALIEAMNNENRYRAYDAALGRDYLPRQHYYRNRQLPIDLEKSEIEKVLLELEEYVNDTPGNRWIRKNIHPVTGILGTILGAATLGAGSKAVQGVSSYARRYLNGRRSIRE